MEQITITTVNATPRAPSFTYFTGAGTITRKTSTESAIIPQDDGTIILLDDLPDTGNEGTLYILRANKLCYVWENGTFELVASLTKILAGNNITISPAEGVGNVTITAADPPVKKIVAGSNVSISPTSGLGDVTISSANAPVTKIIAGTGVTISPTSGLGDVTVSIDQTWLTDFVTALLPE